MGGDRLANSNERAAGFLMARIYGFPPVADANSRVLILGSMPSVKSLEDGFYYGHPRNAFWRVLADVFAEPLPEDIPAKKRLLLPRHKYRPILRRARHIARPNLNFGGKI